VYSDLESATRATLTRTPLEHPDAEAVAAYELPYRRFRDSYRAARPVAG